MSAYKPLSANKYVTLFVVALVVLLLDQGSKIWIRINVPLRKSVEVFPGLFRLVHVENPGAAWGIMSDSSYRMPFFIGAALIAFVVIGVYVTRIPRGQNHLILAMAMILGGALGNFIDRIVYQSVTDYFDFFIAWDPIARPLIRTFRSNHWPAFNIADVAIVSGLLIILYDMFVLEPKRMKAETAGEPLSSDEGVMSSVSGGGSF